MKNLNFLKPFLIVVIVAFLVSNCKKDDTAYTGTVQVTFVNHPNDLSVNIFPVENANIAVFGNLKPNGNGVLTQELNMGDYIIAPYSLTVYYGTSGFQVQAGKTTKITFDHNNMVHIQ